MTKIETEKKKDIIKQIYDFLKQKKVNVYFPEQHKGDCLERYVTILKGGTVNIIGSNKVEQVLYTIQLSFPITQYSRIEEYIKEIKKYLRELYPLIMYVGNETPPIFDDTNNSWVVTFQYTNYRYIKNMI